MNLQDIQVNAAVEAVAASAAAPVAERPLTKNQLKASALADASRLRSKWKGLVAEARLVWPKVPVEDLARVQGDFHRLAGMVQLRYQLGRQESDRQVHEFMDKHYAKA